VILLKNFFRGVLAGIGNIIPGLSGCALLVIFGIYEDCLNAISHLFKDFKSSLRFLFPIGLGVVFGTFLFSNFITYFTNHHLMFISIVFVGFLIGTLPSLFQEATKQGYQFSYLIFFFITFILGVLLLFFKLEVVGRNALVGPVSFVQAFLSGIVLAISTIIPGISSTVLLSMIGMYTTYLNAINTFQFSILIPMGIGFLCGGFLLSKVLNYLLKNFYGPTFFAILGFTIATIPALFFTKIYWNFETFLGIICALFAFLITTYTFSLSKKKQ